MSPSYCQFWKAVRNQIQTIAYRKSGQLTLLASLNGICSMVLSRNSMNTRSDVHSRLSPGLNFGVFTAFWYVAGKKTFWSSAL